MENSGNCGIINIKVRKMENKILDVTKKMNNLLKGQKVLVACSTGIDSTVLLDLCLNSKAISKIVVAHVNHQKRQAADLEEAYIKEFCEKNNISCYTLKLPKEVEGNFQEWARIKRYDFFNEIMKKESLNYLLTAHHADDNLETILMRFIKGSSLKGYVGILEQTYENGYNIYRPLLSLTKEDIKEYAVIKNLKYFEDASNKEDDYTRNRIRKYIVPLLLKENPSLYQAVGIYANTLLETSLMLEQQINNFVKKEVIVNNNIISFPIKSFLQETEFFQTELLFSLLKPYALATTCIKEIIKKITSSKSMIVSDINNDLVLIKEYGMINLVPKKEMPSPFFLKIEQDGVYKLPNNQEFIVDKNICYLGPKKEDLWYNIPELPIIVRTRKAGDSLHFSGGTKTISNYLTDKKVSQINRMKILLICDKDDKPLYMIK